MDNTVYLQKGYYKKNHYILYTYTGFQTEFFNIAALFNFIIKKNITNIDLSDIYNF